MKLNITALLLLLSAMPTATHAESLGRVYELALENDYQFQRAIATYHADLELPTIARSELLPKITADYLLRSVNEDSTTRQLITTGNGRTTGNRYGP